MTNTVMLHPGLRDLMARRGLSSDALHGNGRLTLTVDGQYRLHFRPDIDARLVLYARIAALPNASESDDNDRWIERLMNAGAGLLRDHASTLSIEPQFDDLILQQSLPAAATGKQLEAELAEFINAMNFWRETGKRI